MTAASIHAFSPDFASHLAGSHYAARSMNGLDALAVGSQYALQQLRDASMHRFDMGRPHDGKPVSSHGSAANPFTKTKAAGGPVRRRISRACDQCNQLRTKCDGKFPCAHCVEFGLTCEYARERKKRGKASRKEIAAQQAAAAAAAANASSTGSGTEADRASPRSSASEKSGKSRDQPDVASDRPDPKRRKTNDTTISTAGNHQRPNIPNRAPSMTASTISSVNNNNVPDVSFAVPAHPASITSEHLPADQSIATMDHAAAAAAVQTPMMGQYPPSQALSVTNMNNHNMVHRSPFAVSDYNPMDEYGRAMMHHPAQLQHQQAPALHVQTPMQGLTPHMNSYNPYAMPSPHSQTGGQVNQFRIADSPISGNGIIGQSPHAGSPAWLDIPSPSASMYANLQQQAHLQQSLRFPVLKPLLPRIASIIPVALACDLLELYFASSSSAFVQPASPYILGFILRKRSVLRKSDYRPCSQALLASMLWVSAQTSESFFLTSPPAQRAKICQQLLELTIDLLKPLVHTSTTDSSTYANQSLVNGVALGGFGVADPNTHDPSTGTSGATVGIDDVITYINLATVVSASEYKAASLRWWNIAWSLARELKLGREMPSGSSRQARNEPLGHSPHGDIDMNMQQSMPGATPQQQQGNPFHSAVPHFSEEEREERRRIWWLLYIVDRHLALCYNRPLFLLDIECDGLLQPENEEVWQSGEYYPPENHEQSLFFRRRGPCFECTGHGIFGYFLPLMTILGEIVEINHAKNHPRFGMRFGTGNEWDGHIKEIEQQLDAYGRSLKDFEARYIPMTDTDKGPNGEICQDSPSVHSTSTGTTRMTEAMLQTKIVVAYGTHMMHTLHILLNGKWDPISLLDDNDLWISSPSFLSATSHAVSAAEAIGDILEYDPDLSFMPFFFGIYLLQGSFLLLLIADKLRTDASPNVVRACETIVRAHEVCVVTLNTEYQRNFRKVMRSALAQVKGRLPEDFGEQQQRRREVLSLYRWSGDGNGLAL